MPTITTFEEKLESFKKCHNFVFFCQTWLVVCCTFTQLNCFVVFGKPMHWGAHIWASSYFETQHSLHRQNSTEEFKRLFWPDVTVRFFVFGSWNFIPIVSGNKFYETLKHNIRSNHIYPNTQNGKFSWIGCYFVPWTMNMLKMTMVVKKRDIDLNDDNDGNERKPPCSRQRRRPCPTCQTQLAVSGSEHGFVRNYICEREVKQLYKTSVT